MGINAHVFLTLFKPFSVGESKDLGGTIKSYKIVPGKESTGNEYLEKGKHSLNQWKGGQLFTFWAYDHSKNMIEEFAVGEESKQHQHQRFILEKGETINSNSYGGGWKQQFTFWAFDPDQGKAYC